MDKGQESTALHSALGHCGRNARVGYYCEKEETSVNKWRGTNSCVTKSLEKQLPKEAHIASCYQWQNAPPGKYEWIRRQYSVDRSGFAPWTFGKDISSSCSGPSPSSSRLSYASCLRDQTLPSFTIIFIDAQSTKQQ